MSLPRVVVYHQTHFHEGNFVSLTPLLSSQISITHVILAAVHLNPGESTKVTLNDDLYNAPRLDPLWRDVVAVQQAGVKVLAMLGGACRGSYPVLDRDPATFAQYYEPLRRMIADTKLDGLDLDVEEDMSLAGIIRLIDKLKQDFGPDFIVTLAPVATAMQRGLRHLSGFSYFDLEKAFGRNISWYNAQFYCGWGDISTTSQYDNIVSQGWPASKIVMGVVTNPKNGTGWVEDDVLVDTLLSLVERHGPGFGGVMGWEYFNSLTSEGVEGQPWGWAELMTVILRCGEGG